MIIDLRSDTVTKPSKEMLEFMASCQVGDDVFEEDPTIKKLEEKISKIFGMEAGLFCPSGTMSNQIAIKVHTQPGDEVICDKLSHIYNFEGGGIAFNSGCSIRLLDGDRGRFTANDVLQNINPSDIHHPQTRLVSVENTCNKGGGSCWDLVEIEKIGKLCYENNLKYHLDGARLMNALKKTGDLPENYGYIFDSISICFSKGLGAPVGSILLGTNDFINKSRRIRKVLGGAMRQAGYLAGAAIFAIDYNFAKLADDHQRAKELEKTLKNLAFVDNILPVETNIVVFSLNNSLKVSDFLKKLEENQIKAVPFGVQTIRMVTHLDFTDIHLEKTIKVLKQLY